MTPTHTRKDGRQYRYYITRTAAGEDRQTAWRVPAGEIERIVIGAVVMSLRDHTETAGGTADTVVADVVQRTDLAGELASHPGKHYPVAWAEAEQADHNPGETCPARQ